MPVVLLEKSVRKPNGELTSISHCAVMKENTIHETGANRFIILKNSNKEDPELKIKLNMTSSQNDWKLLTPICYYIKLD